MAASCHGGRVQLEYAESREFVTKQGGQMTPREVVESFYAALNTNDFAAATSWFSDDYECFWPQSSELICGRQNFAEINTRYPAHGRWQFSIESMVGEGDAVTTSVKVTDGVIRAVVITFHTIERERISRQVEYWPDSFAAPAWRRQWVKIVNNGSSLPVEPGFNELYSRAKSVINPQRLSEYAESGGVGAAILSETGNIYTGVCIDTASSMGFCAEHAAAAAMISAGESKVKKMLALDSDGRIMPPCGRCREFISQLHEENGQAEVKISEDQIFTLAALLPHDWKKYRPSS